MLQVSRERTLPGLQGRPVCPTQWWGAGSSLLWSAADRAHRSPLPQCSSNRAILPGPGTKRPWSRVGTFSQAAWQAREDLCVCVSGGSGPHMPKVFSVTSPGRGHNGTGHLPFPCPLLPHPRHTGLLLLRQAGCVASCWPVQIVLTPWTTAPRAHLAPSYTFCGSLLRCHHFREASPDHPI